MKWNETRRDEVTTTINLLGWYMYECPYLDNPAKQLNPNKTVNPKNTTAFSRTQTVCIVFYSLPLCAMLGMETVCRRRRRSVVVIWLLYGTWLY